MTGTEGGSRLNASKLSPSDSLMSASMMSATSPCLMYSTASCMLAAGPMVLNVRSMASIIRRKWL